MKRLIIGLLSLLPITLLAQERTDTLTLRNGTPATATEGITPQDIIDLTSPLPTRPDSSLSLPASGIDTNLHPLDASSLELHSPSDASSLQPHAIPASAFVTPYPLPHWSTGYIYGSQGMSGNIFQGYNTHATAGLVQQLGNYWSVRTSVSLNKYSVYAYTGTVSGSVTWQPSRYFALTAFGAYQTGNFLSSSPQFGPSFYYGGYATFQTDTDLPFGIDVGAYNAYDPFSGHQVTPIVQPFVKVGGAKLGIDLGPMIRDAIWNASGRGRNGMGGPGLMPQPIKAMPRIAPRN